MTYGKNYWQDLMPGHGGRSPLYYSTEEGLVRGRPRARPRIALLVPFSSAEKYAFAARQMVHLGIARKPRQYRGCTYAVCCSA